MAVLVRCLRQFNKGADVLTVEKALVLPDVPTMGTRLDLRAEGVETALTVVGVTLRAIPDTPSIRPSVDVLLHYEPSEAAELARAAGWRDSAPPEPQKD